MFNVASNSSLKPGLLLEELAVYQHRDIDIENDLVFFDEIQDCDRAVTSLKYFQENLPSLHLIGAGSLMSVKRNFASFPVGKVGGTDGSHLVIPLYYAGKIGNFF